MKDQQENTVSNWPSLRVTIQTTLHGAGTWDYPLVGLDTIDVADVQYALTTAMKELRRLDDSRRYSPKDGGKA